MPGLEAAWVNSALAIHNATWPDSPLQSPDDLRRRLTNAADDARASGLPWIFYVFEPETPAAVMEQADAIAAAFNIHPMGQLRVMLGDTAALTPPLHPLPAADLFRVTTTEHATMALDLNTRAYGMPDFITASVVESGAYFRDPRRDFGFVALNTAGEPVATTTVIELKGWIYVAAVATAPEHRRQGYAELVMREALRAASAATGITRTALDASLLGASLYSQMGYKASGDLWRMYVSM